LQLEKWIDENVSSLPSKELEARGKQLQIMKDILFYIHNVHLLLSVRTAQNLKSS
jgi:hypothetical protein